MASKNPVEEERRPCRFSDSLSSAVSELILLFLLLLNGFFSYLVSKFARYCKLQTPCLFCSRFDHVLDCACPSVYDDLICTSHKLEISSLSYCHIHQNLADVREMCETCLLSFSTVKKSNSETCSSLVGKLEINQEDNVIPKLHKIAESGRSKPLFQAEDMAEPRTPLFQSSRVASFKVKNDDMFGFLSKRSCSCCAEMFRMRSHAQRLLQVKTTGANIAEPDIPVLGLTPRNLSFSRDAFKKRNELSMSPSIVSHGTNGVDKLSHLGYKELKITSDSESEVPVSEDDDGNTLAEMAANVKEETSSHLMTADLPPINEIRSSKSSSNETASENMIHDNPIVHDVPPSLREKHDIHVNDTSYSSLCKINTARSDGLEELNLDDVGRGHHPANTDTVCHPIATEVSSAQVRSDDNNNGEEACLAFPEVEESKAVNSTETIPKTNQASNATVLPTLNVMDLKDAYELVKSKGDASTSKNTSRIPENLRLLLSHISRGLESPSNDITSSPRMHGLVRQDSRISEGSGTSGQPNLIKRFSLERNESGLESSLDGSTFAEIDCETAIDKLKQHVELERKSLSILYKELEEERNASAIAANQAMAMITRLQEEKAAMQMEALQYQRMMESQVEYDQEALQNQCDLLAEMEKEILDLEEELACYKRQFIDDFRDEEAQALMAEEMEDRKDVTPPTKQYVAGPKTPKVDSSLLNLDMNESTVVRDSFLGFEEEKQYIFERLRELENKLHLCSKVVSPDHESKVYEFPIKVDQNKDDKEKIRLHEEENGQTAYSATSFQEDSYFTRGQSHPKTTTITNHHENGELSPIRDQQNKESPTFTSADYAAIKHQMSDLNNRLESMEADKYFLEHMISSLQNGKEGLLFVQQIAQHLQELRKIRIS